MTDQVREIALITNPTAGKGKGGRAREAALGRLRDSGLVVRNLAGRDADEALELAHQCVADGVEALVVCGGDGMVQPRSPGRRGHRDAAGHHPRRHGQRRRAVLRPAAYGPGRGGRSGGRPPGRGRIRTVDLARSGGKYFVTVMAAGFDAIVNERANRMTWPKGQMRYNIATLAELRTFQPLAYTLDLDGEQRRLEAMLVAVGNGPSFGGGLRITEGALLDDGLLDVVIIKPMSKAGLVRTYPKLFKGTHVTHPQYEHHRVRSRHGRRAGHRGVRRRRAVRRAAPHRGVRSRSAERPRHERSHSLGAVRVVRRRPQAPRPAGLRRALPVPARRLPGRGLPADRGRPRRAGRGADRVRQDAGGRVRGPPGAGDRPQVLLHHPDQGAVEPEVPRPRRPLRRRPGRPADRRQQRSTARRRSS